MFDPYGGNLKTFIEIYQDIIKALNNIQLHAVMIKDPFTLQPEQPVIEAIIPMVHHKYGCIPVVDKKKILCGIITQYDILKTALEIFKA